MSAAGSPAGMVLGRCLGRGKFGEVFAATFAHDPGKTVAVKRIARGSLNAVRIEALVSEIASVKKLRHPHIVALIDIHWNDRWVFLIIEYCNGRDLAAFLAEYRRPPEFVVWHFFGQLVDALLFLAKHRLVHRDLKPANLMLHYSRGGPPLAGRPLDGSTLLPILKVADFGFASRVKPHEQLSGMLGTPLYMAPEILTSPTYDARADLWSLGIIAHEMAFGYTPFQSRTREELLARLTSPEDVQLPADASVSAELIGVIRGLLRRDPAQRTALEQLAALPQVKPHLSTAADVRAAAAALPVRAPASAELYRAGTEHAQRAVALDKAQKYAEALPHYEAAAAHLLSAARAEPDPAMGRPARERCEMYITRAEEIKAILKQQQQQQQRPSGAARVATLRRSDSEGGGAAPRTGQGGAGGSIARRSSAEGAGPPLPAPPPPHYHPVLMGQPVPMGQPLPPPPSVMAWERPLVSTQARVIAVAPPDAGADANEPSCLPF